ncbi:MAG: HVO_0476 family zinc finger protein [Halohasta sp.]
MSDIDAGDRVALACPSCSPREETVHEVLKPGGDVTVRCTDCSHVHKTQIESTPTVEKRVIVSQDGESFSTHLESDPTETVEVGDEFIVDTPEAILQVRVTGLELLDSDSRVESAVMEDVETVWTRAVDNVGVNVTLHPKDGSRDDTRSLKVNVPGDYEFTVGETESFGDDEFTITGIFVRDDAEGYRFDKFDERGDMVYAKDSKRIYGTDETTSAWSAW